MRVSKKSEKNHKKNLEIAVVGSRDLSSRHHYGSLFWFFVSGLWALCPSKTQRQLPAAVWLSITSRCAVILSSFQESLPALFQCFPSVASGCTAHHFGSLACPNIPRPWSLNVSLSVSYRWPQQMLPLGFLPSNIGPAMAHFFSSAGKVSLALYLKWLSGSGLAVIHGTLMKRTIILLTLQAFS